MTGLLTGVRAPVPVPAGPATPGRGRTAQAVRWLLGLLAVAVVASVLVGSRMVAPRELLHDGSAGQAILQTRLPRTVLGLLAGAALGLAGGCLQGLTRNPLADTGLLGVNAGSSFAMVLAVSVVGVSSLHTYVWFALGGAAVAAVGVHLIASCGRDGATPAKLVLVGAALSAGVASWTSAVLLTDKQTFDVMRRWQVGTIGGRGWEVVLTGLPFLVAGAVLALAGARTLDTLALGDDLARGLGRRTLVDRLVVGIAVVLLAGTATALCGPIAFVGLVVPHAVRAMVGTAYSRVLPLAAGYGAVLVVLADVAGRGVMPPTEVQVGIMTAVVGVPAFCWFLRRGRMAGL